MFNRLLFYQKYCLYSFLFLLVCLLFVSIDSFLVNKLTLTSFASFSSQTSLFFLSSLSYRQKMSTQPTSVIEAYPIPSIDPSYIYQANNHFLSSIYSLNPKDRLILLLIGIPGSGKSTFSSQLIHDLNEAGCGHRWTSLNQDKLKSRQKVLSHMKDTMFHKQNIIIDRCNFDIEQRSHWITLTDEMNRSLSVKYHVIALILPNYLNVNLCAQRAFERGNSDGIHDLDTNWMGVCRRMYYEFMYPNISEGLLGLFHAQSEEDLIFLRQCLVQQQLTYLN